MKEITHYECEICHTQFKEKKKAEECEKSHVFATGIKSVTYKPYTSSQDGLPVYVTIEFDNGKEYKFKRA